MTNSNTKLQVGAAVLGGIALLALSSQAGPTAPAPQDGLDQRVEKLELQVIGLEASVNELRAALGEARTLVDQTTEYLAVQAERAADMSKTLDESEELGFTKGINYTSREVLLEGWRAALKAQQTDVPGAKQAGAQQAAGARGRGGQ